MVEYRLQWRQSEVCLRRYRSTFPGNLRRDSLRELTQRAIVDQQIRLGLPQHIYKARRNNQTFGIDHALRVNSIELSDCSNAISTNGDIAGHPWISRAVNNRAVFDQHIVFLAGELAGLQGQRRIVSGGGNFSERLSCDFLRGLRIIHGYGNHVDVQRKNQMLAARRIHVTCKALTGYHQLSI